MSTVDFSEFRYISTDKEIIQSGKDEMLRRGIITDHGNSSPTSISVLLDNHLPRFFSKLRIRLAHWPGEIRKVYRTMAYFYDKREYTGAFYHLLLMYEYLQWKTPDENSPLPCSEDALKLFLKGFLSRFRDYLEQDDSRDTETMADSEEDKAE